jgi:hypothetical protein
MLLAHFWDEVVWASFSSRFEVLSYLPQNLFLASSCSLVLPEVQTSETKAHWTVQNPGGAYVPWLAEQASNRDLGSWWLPHSTIHGGRALRTPGYT